MFHNVNLKFSAEVPFRAGLLVSPTAAGRSGGHEQSESRVQSKPGFLTVFTVKVAIACFQGCVLQAAPIENTGNSKNPDKKTHTRTVIRSPTEDPENEARIHR